jgi:hypothetical protein
VAVGKGIAEQEIEPARGANTADIDGAGTAVDGKAEIDAGEAKIGVGARGSGRTGGRVDIADELTDLGAASDER